jgi:hypothetical protein
MISSVCTLRLNLRRALSMDSPSCNRTSAKIHHLQTSPTLDIWSLARYVRDFAVKLLAQEMIYATVFLAKAGSAQRPPPYHTGNCDAEGTVQLETAHIPCGGCESTSLSELLNRVQEFVACDKALCRKQTGECFDDFSCAEIHGECHHRRFALKVTR